MNNEPVAYRWKWDAGLEWHYADYYTDRDYFKLEPLYTHPVEEQDESFDRTASHMAGEYVSYKPELTDEEWKLLDKVINNCEETIEYRIDVERLAFKGYEHCSELEILYEEQKDASKARAILKKASEK